MIPAGVDLFFFDPALLGLILPEQIEGEPAQRREVFRSLPDSGAVLIFAEADVHHSVHFVFHSLGPIDI